MPLALLNFVLTQALPGYQTLAGKNISTQTGLGMLVNLDPGAQAWAAPQMCNSTDACDVLRFVDNYALGSFASDPDVTSYIKTTSCPAPGTAGKAIAGYLSCDGIDFHSFTAYAKFDLPPFLVQQACDNAAVQCSGFSVNAAGTFGHLYSSTALPNASTAIKLISARNHHAATRSLGEVSAVDKQQQIGASTPSTYGFYELAGASLGAPIRKGVFAAYLGVCNNALLTAPLLKALCGATSTCDIYMDAPAVTNSSSGAVQWSIWSMAPDKNVTTYVDTTFCRRVDNTFLECTGLDATKGGVPGEAYDLPSKIVHQVCTVKGCHAYVESNDDSGGTLYTFVAADAGVNTYFHAPAVRD